VQSWRLDEAAVIRPSPPGPTEFPQQFLPPGFEHLDQCFLFLGLFDQGGAFCGIGWLVLALANTPPQIRGCLPEPRQVFLHDAELSLKRIR
jgi:hypothetical protein